MVLTEFLQRNPLSECGFILHFVTTGHAIAIIIVVCIGFLLLMIALGVIRIRAAHMRVQQEEIQETEMAWDDSALNIIVNPMEVSFSSRNFYLKR